MALKVISKVNQRVRFIARLSTFLNRRALEILSGALVQCHYDYACSSWYSAIPKILKTRLQSAQNKLVRIILKLHPRTHLLPEHFDSLKWLRVEERVTLIKLCMVHRILNNAAPDYLRSYFIKVSDVHDHATRGSFSNLVPVRFKRNIGQNTFRYTACVAWNDLPSFMKSMSSLISFKIALKRWLRGTS